MTSANGKIGLRNWLTDPTTAFLLRIILGCVFIYASLDKIKHPDLFAEAVYNYQLLPEMTVNLVAISLPWFELLSGSLLVLGMWMEGSILILSGLMVVFIGALGINLARGLDVHCGCFITQSSDPITILTLFRDSLFLLLAFYLFWLYQIRGVEGIFSLERVFRRDSSRPDIP